MKRRTASPFWRRCAVGVAGVCGSCAALWCIGQLTRDRWLWSQLLFWIPAPTAALAAMIAALLLWRLQTNRARRLSLLCGLLLSVAVAMTLRTDVGWGCRAETRDARSVSVLHWNVRAPGVRAVEFGRAVAAVDADIYIVSNPGHIGRPSNAQQWVPEGWTLRDCGPFVLVSRLPVESARVLAFVPEPVATGLWLAAIEVRAPGGETLHILVVDLPSSVGLARATVAEWAAGYLRLYPDLPAPDLLVGDFNNTPRSVVFDALPQAQPPTPSQACGWLGTFPRALPLWHIDCMRTSSRWEFERYETIDLGVGLHRAQRGVVTPNDAGGIDAAQPRPFPADHDE